MKNIVVSLLFCSSFVLLHSDDLTQEQQIAQEQMAQVRKLIAFRNALFCSQKECELAPCQHNEEDLLKLVFGHTTSLVPTITLQNSDDFYTWMSKQENTLLMVSKPGCIPCAQAHAFISGYLDKNRLKAQVVGIALDHARVLADQGVFELKSIAGTPEFFIIKDGKVVHSIPSLDAKELRMHVAQNLV